MGVTGLWKLIDASGKPVPLEMLENKVLAVDISIWLHQVVKGFQDQKGNAVPNAHLLGLFNRLCKLLYYRIKPVFVFDGGVPMLKRETIAKRYQSKNKIQIEADRIQQLLLNSLAKEQILQKAIGAVTPTKVGPKPVISPSKKNNIKAIEQDELFKLPELPKDAVLDASTAESDSSSDEGNEVNYYRNLKTLDVNSTHFKSLPPDVRYDLLSDIKETRKHSSWSTIHELPAESNEFCSFQMKRLLRRRKVQVELEETEKELSGKCLTMDVLENLLKEDGIEVDQNIAVGGQIASDENTRYILVRDLKSVIEKSNLKKEELATIKEEVEPAAQVNPEVIEASTKIEGIKLSQYIHILEDDEEDDLQKAIQMSLATEEENTSFDEVKMTTQQKKVLSTAAQSSLARGFLLENAGMTNEEITELVADHKNDEEDLTLESTFKYNDSFVAYGKKIIPETQVSSDAMKKVDNVVAKSVSSDTDTDLVDVPEADFNSSEMNIFPTLIMNSCMSDEKDASKDFRIEDLEILKNISTIKNGDSKLIQVFVKPDEIKQDEEDIFADIFVPKSDLKPPQTVTNITINTENPVNNILKQLEKEKSEILKLDLNDIHLDSSLIQEHPLINLQQILNNNLQTQIELNDSQDTVIDETLQILVSTKDINDLKDEDSNVVKTQPNIEEHVDKPISEEITKPIEAETIEIKDDVLEENLTPTFEEHVLLETPKKLEQETINPENAIEEASTKFQEIETIEIKEDSLEENTASKLEKRVLFETPKKLEQEPINPEKAIEEAATKLRENKSKDELIDMMSELSKEQNNLQIDKNKQDRFSASITEQMSRECMDLLTLFGVPYIVAPMEAEAQCAFLNFVNLTDGTITDDSDIWLFGGQTVYKNFFNQKKNVMEFRMENIEKLYKMDRDKMIQIAFLTGSDYTSGINGIGAVTALEILASFPSTPEQEGETNKCMSILSGLRKFKNWFQNSKAVTTTPQKHSLKSKLKNIEITDNFPHINIVEAYLFPTVDENLENFNWGYPNAKSIQEFARKSFGWTTLKTDETLTPVLKKLDDRKSQQSITNYFKLQSTPTVKDLKVSKRVKQAINQMGGNLEIEEKPKKTRAVKKPKETPNANTETTTDEVAVVDITADDGEKPKVGRKRKSAQNLALTQDKIVKRQPRKRKAKTEDDVQPIDIATTVAASSEIEPSTSTSSPIIVRKNNVKSKLGDTSHIDKKLHQKEVITQRTKDEQDREESRLRAAEIFKKSKKS